MTRVVDTVPHTEGHTNRVVEMIVTGFNGIDVLKNHEYGTSHSDSPDHDKSHIHSHDKSYP